MVRPEGPGMAQSVQDQAARHDESLAKGSMARRSQILNRAVLALVIAGIAAGLVSRLAGHFAAAQTVWAGITLVALVPLAFTVIRNLLSGSLGVDIIALLAMAGALLLQEYLAGAVIALM